MFWKLAPEDVIAKPAGLSCANVQRVWSRRKHIMEKALRRSWTENERSTRTMQLREYALKEFWEIFVDDRPFGADAFSRHANVQSKAAFSYAMATTDAMQRYGENEWDENSKHACGSTPKKS